MLRPAAVLAFAALASTSQAQLPPAAYAPPPVGTRYVFSGMTNTITRNDGFRTYFEDGAGRSGLRTGTFIPDNPAAPLEIDARAMAQLWPLRLGKSTTLEAKRGPLVWKWDVSVVDTATVTVPAGRFMTYVVEAVETPRVAPRPDAWANVTVFWYAPANGAVVRFKSGQLLGPRRNFPMQQELLRVERVKPAASRATR